MFFKRLLPTLFFGLVVIAGLQSCVDSEDPTIGEVTQEIAPPPPTNLTVTNATGGFTPAQQLNWTASPGATRYVVLRGTAGPGSETSYTSCCTNGTTSFYANHLEYATSYCWQVKAVNSIGQSSAPSNEVCLSTAGAQTVDPPATVTATAVSSSRINVDWSAVTDATRYYVNQSISGNPYARIATVSAPGMSYPVINLTPGTSYCYTIEAVTNYGQSVPSAPACDTTFSLGLEGYWRLTATSGTTAADESGFGRNLALASGASFSAAAPQAPIDPPVGNNEPHLDSGTGTGRASSAPDIAAFRLGQAFSVVFWVRQVTAGDAKLMGMRVDGNCTGSGPGWEIAQTATGLQFIGEQGSLSFGQSLTVGDWTHVAVTFSGGANGTIRAYINGSQVASGMYTAANSLGGALTIGHVAGCAGAQAWFDEAQIYSRELSGSDVATFGTRPPAPTGLAITKNTSTAQLLAWTAPASGADRWIILRGLSSGAESHYTHAPNPPTTFNASHLMSETTYFWQVQTVQNHLISLPSNEVSATTNAAPAAPTGVTATAVSQTRINVSWTAVPNATDYFIYQATSSAGPFTLKGHVASPTVVFGATGLTANTTYWYQVTAKDSGGLTSAPSSPAVSATTLP